MSTTDVNVEDFSVFQCLYNKNYPGWSEKLEEHKSAILQLSNLIEKKEKEFGKFYPLKENIFKALEMTPLDKVKIVIWGQDPYPTLLDNGEPRAQGYSFGVDKTDQVPQSLKKYLQRKLKIIFPTFSPPDHGDFNLVSKPGNSFHEPIINFLPYKS